MALPWGMITCVAIEEGAPRALRLAQRIDRVAIPDRELARRAKVSRNSVKAARDGRAAATTYGKLERALDEFEHETGADEPDMVVVVIEMPDGVRATVRGVDAQEAARFAAEFVAARNREGSAPS